MDKFKDARVKFTGARASAKERGIEFLMTFDEWWQVWQDSGHWENRGHSFGQYVMGRFGDEGPYVLGNVKIITNSENSRESAIGNKYWVGKKHKLSSRRKMRQVHLGVVLSKETKSKMREAQRRRRDREREAGISNITFLGPHTPKTRQLMRRAALLREARKREWRHAAQV